MDGQTREGEAFGLKPNQTVRHGREARRVFSREENTKPRQSLNNITTGVREREDTNRTREAGNRDEVEGVIANTLKLFRHGACLLANTFTREAFRSSELASSIG